MLWMSSWMMTGLAHAGAAEQPDLAALQVRLEQVDDLDARFEHAGLGGLLHQRRGRAVDGQRSAASTGRSGSRRARQARSAPGPSVAGRRAW